jgi:hypothetical protein
MKTGQLKTLSFFFLVCFLEAAGFNADASMLLGSTRLVCYCCIVWYMLVSFFAIGRFFSVGSGTAAQ